MSFGLVVYTFGNTPRAAGGRSDTAQAIRDVPDAVHVAEQVGLDSSASRTPRALDAAVLADIPGQRRPAPTQRIKLGTTVTVLPTDEPLQVFQQLAAAAAIALPHRGRRRPGSSAITFGLFELDEPRRPDTVRGDVAAHGSSEPPSAPTRRT